MKSKIIKWIFWAAIIFIVVYLIVKLANSESIRAFVSGLKREILEKERQLNLLLSELDRLTAKQAILDRIVEFKTVVATYIFLSMGFVLSLISGFYHQDAFISAYAAFKDAAGYLLIIVCYTIYKKMPSVAMFQDVLSTYFRKREYKKHAFDPEYIPVLHNRIETVRYELLDLRSRLAMKGNCQSSPGNVNPN